MKKLALFIVFGLISLVSARQIVAQSFLTDGLVAYFPFNGSANDATTNANNGTAVGSMTYGVDRYGTPNACLALPGGASVSNGVDVTNLNAMKYAPATYSAWVLISSYPALSGVNMAMTLVGREQCSQQRDGAVCIYSAPSISATNVFAYFYGANGGYARVTPPTNKWCQLVSSLDTNGALKLYLNGVSLGVTGSGATTGASVDFRIGASSGRGCGYEQTWNGLIDDVRIYNRVLSDSEVSGLYQYEAAPCDNAAYAVATAVNGFVIGVTVTDGGCGFTNVPKVVFSGGGGAGAAGVAVVSNGIVTSIQITDAGNGYTNAPDVIVGNPPFFTKEPSSVTITNGATLELSGLVAGSNLGYQWIFDGTNVLDIDSGTLLIENASITNAGTYELLATNYFGSVESSNVFVSMAPYIEQGLVPIQFQWGFSNALSVTAYGSGPLTYQWYDNGVAVAGATNNTLVFNDAQFTNAGLYSVVITGPGGRITNGPASVAVNAVESSIHISPTVTITGVVGNNYIIQRTTGLTGSDNWTTVTNITLTQPVETWTDTSVNVAYPGTQRPYYRLLPGTP